MIVAMLHGSEYLKAKDERLDDGHLTVIKCGPSLETNGVEPKTNGPQMRPVRLIFGGEDRSRTDLDGFAGRCITALLPRQRI